MNPFELTKRIGKKTPIDPMTIQRVTGTVTNTVAGVQVSGWMGPHQPLLPQQQGTAMGRRFDYPVGLNLQYTPRGTEGISFDMLRTLADGYDLLRLLIETRKDQLVKFGWNIQPIDPEKRPKPGAKGSKVKTDPRCDEIKRFLRFPDKRNNWQTWLRALVEDMLVIDAATIYPRMTRGGDLYALDLMDGATLKMVIDQEGRRPDPPSPAYQQVIKGIPAVDYHADELIYAPRNVRTNRLYGYSPVEQIIMTVNIALRRQLSQLDAYTSGNVPDALATVPKEWNTDQIAAWQEYWDALLSGNTAETRKMRFIPDGMKYYPTKEALLKDPFDEWLARVCCFAFSLPAAPFIKEMNRATSETAKEAATEEGLHPLMSWVKGSLDLVLWRYWGYDDLEFAWEMEQAASPQEQMEIDTGYVKIAVRSVDEVRADLGLDPIGMPNAVFTGTGATLIKDVLNPPEPLPGMFHGAPGQPGKGAPPFGKGPGKGAPAAAKAKEPAPA